MARHSLALGLVAIAWGVVLMSAAAADPESEPVDAARESLKEVANFPWYDSANDTLRRIDAGSAARNEEEALNRASRWEANTNRRRGPTLPTTPSLSLPTWLSYLFRGLLIVLAIVIICAIVGLLIWAFMRGEDRSAAGTAAGESDVDDAEQEADRIERLPFQVARPTTDLLSEARRCYEQGEFGQAAIYFFSYQLVQLDKHQRIRLAKGKTNRQYLRELRRGSPLRTILASSMIAFEDVFFGHHTLTRERFEQDWLRLDEFKLQLEQESS